MKCTYCNKIIGEKDSFEFFPHEGGGYCIFAPRDKTDYACESCARKKCEDCGKVQVRYAFIECKKCNKVHCFNNTDMKYENNPFLSHIKLCDSMNCKQDD